MVTVFLIAVIKKKLLLLPGNLLTLMVLVKLHVLIQPASKLTICVEVVNVQSHWVLCQASLSEAGLA
jgi:hypothetical protein